MYDAIFVLGGSFIDKNTLPKWSEARLNAAIKMDGMCKFFILLSRGTTHKPPALDKNGYTVDESTIMANYLIKAGIPPEKIIKETWSLDTIGNAYAALVHHAIPRNMRKLLVITSNFHMPRSKAIFQKVFSLFPMDLFDLNFLETDSSLEISSKEIKSLETWIERSKNIHTLCDLHDFIFLNHNAYNVLEDEKETVTKDNINDMEMYCLFYPNSM